MKTMIKVWVALLAFALVACLAWLAAAHHWGPWPDSIPLIHVDDDSITVGGIGMANGLLAVSGLVIGLLVVFTVVPLVVALALGGAAIAVAVGLAAAALGVLIPLSPFLLVGWLLWRALRKPASPPAAPASAADGPPPAATIAA